MESKSLYQPRCLMAHGLVNKLSVVVGQCDLLEEKSPEDSECLTRLHLIRDIAKAMAKELNEHQCHLDVMTRMDVAKKPVSVAHAPVKGRQA